MRIVTISAVTAQLKESRKSTSESAKSSLSRSPQRITSRALLGGQRELVIEHDGRDYRLRLTQQGKLILTA